MLDFKPLLPEDSSWLRPVLSRTPDICCECSPACMVMWGNASIAQCGDFFVPMVTYDGRSIYLRPLGGTDFAPILPEILADSRERGIAFQMYGITPPVRAYLEQHQNFVYTAERAYFDYVYPIEALANLSGHKYQAKRNHINRFEEEHSDWTTEPITRENIRECEEMTTEWYYEHYGTGVDPAFYDGERRALSLAFDHFEAFGLDGLLIRTEGRVVAWSMGAPMTETVYDVNFEKAFSSIQGSYPLINREFSRMVQQKYPNIRYLDREDDMGEEGLRKAKLSYHPEVILEKYTALLPEDAR